MPFQCSSQRRTKRAVGLFLSPSSFLPPSRSALSVRLPVMRPSILRHAADVFRYRHAVVVEDHQQVGLRIHAAGVVQGFVGHAGGHRAIADHRNDLAVVAGARIGDRHAERGGNRRRRMADAEGVVLAFLALRERRDAVLLLDRVDRVAAAGQDLVRIASGGRRPRRCGRRAFRRDSAGRSSVRSRRVRRRNVRRSGRPIRSGRRAIPRRRPAVRRQANWRRSAGVSMRARRG